MNILFREGASTNEKIFTIFSLFWMGFGVYGMSINFDTSIGFNKFIVVGSCVLGIIMITPLYFDTRFQNNRDTLPPIKKVSSILILPLLSIFLSWTILALSLPAIYTENFGSVASDQVKVTQKRARTLKWGSAQIKTSKNNNYYKVPREFFNEIMVDDFIIVKGKRSIYGFRILSFEKMIKNDQSLLSK